MPQVLPRDIGLLSFHKCENYVHQHQLNSASSVFKKGTLFQRPFELSGERNQDRPAALAREPQHARRPTGWRLIRRVLLVRRSESIGVAAPARASRSKVLFHSTRVGG